jgi:hypothetical protein
MIFFLINANFTEIEQAKRVLRYKLQSCDNQRGVPLHQDQNRHPAKIETPERKKEKKKKNRALEWKHVNTPTPFTHHHTAPNGKDKTPDSNTIHNIDKSVIPTKTPALYND